jgi:CspA family cold shock protein
MHQMPTAETSTGNALAHGESYIPTAGTIILHIGGPLMRAFEQSLSPGQSVEEALLKHIAHTVAGRLMHEHPAIFKAVEAGQISFNEGIEKSLDNPQPSCVTGPQIKAGGTQRAKEAQNVRGRVKFFNGNFGFITLEGAPGQADVYIHKSAVQWAGIPTLRPGQRVEFDVRVNPHIGKTFAASVKLIGEAA